MSHQFVRSIIFLILSLLLVVVHGRGIFEDYKTHVRIYNLLENKEDLTVHCESKHDDLGYQYIRHDQYWEWSFFPNFWGGTKFWCSVQWNGAFHWFDAYIAERDTRAKCGILGKQCDWAVYQKQPCMINSSWYQDYCLPWKT